MTPEAHIGEILVRFGLAAAGLILAAWAHYRISAVSRHRIELPERLVEQLGEVRAEMRGSQHMVAELNESLTSHVAKANAREGREARKAAALGEPPAPAGAVGEESVGKAVMATVWDGWPPARRAVFAKAGYRRAGDNGGAILPE